MYVRKIFLNYILKYVCMENILKLHLEIRMSGKYSEMLNLEICISGKYSKTTS